MIAEEYVNYGMNIGLHIFILFTFLTIFFFAFVSKLASDSIQNALDDIIDQQVEKILTEADKLGKRFDTNIDWNGVNAFAKKLEADSQGDLPSIIAHNARLKIIGLGMIIGIAGILMIAYMYFRWVRKYDISLKHMIMENIIIFVFVGIVEYLFFTKIAAKYIPVTPEFVSTSILDRIKARLNASLVKDL
jgi:hypothetical protein